MVYGLLRALPGEPDFVVTVAGAMRMHRRQLSASHGAPGPHDFAGRAFAARLSAPARPPLPASRVVTIAIRPSASRRDTQTIHEFRFPKNRNIFARED